MRIRQLQRDVDEREHAELWRLEHGCTVDGEVDAAAAVLYPL